MHIRWSKTDLEEFFGVDAEFCDPAHSYSFDVSRDGLRLLLTLFDMEGAVYVSIWRDGLPKPLFTIVREACTHALIGVHPDNRRVLQVGSSGGLTTEMGVLPVLSRG